MPKAMQKLPVKGRRIEKKAQGAPDGGSVDLRLKNGMTVSVVYSNTGGTTVTAKSGLGRISNVKGSLGKLIEMIASSDVPSDTVDAMLDEVTKSATRRQPRGGALTKSQADVLVRSGALTADRLATLENRVASGELAALERNTRLGAIARALTAEQAGEHLGGISASRVRHRLNDGLLYAFLAGKSRRYPLWQFVGDDAIPGLKEVTPYFLEGWQPASIEGFMTTPKEELTSGDDAPMSPVEWLAGGGDPAAVVAILDRIART